MRRSIQYVLAGVSATVMASVIISPAQGQNGVDVRHIEPNPSYDGRITFARLRYDERTDVPCTCRLFGGLLQFGWQHDYPRAERSLMMIVATEVRLNVRTDSSMMLKADDPQLMKYPSLYLSEPGCWHPTESEVKALRKYLLKGGFLLVDDFAQCHGTPDQFEASRQNFEEVMRQILPNNELVPLALTDPALNRFFRVNPAGVKEELNRMGAAAGEMLVYGIYDRNDPNRRLIVVANYNVGLHRAWMFEALGEQATTGHDAYKLGVNYLLAGITSY